MCATHYSVKGAMARPVVTPAAACSHEADRIDIHCLPDHRGIYPSSRVLQRSYTILVCLRLDIYSALELNNLFNPTLISIEIDYKSV